ncbi:MAG: hypothetical protein ACM3MK_10235 [Chitinophagales bacterium]
MPGSGVRVTTLNGKIPAKQGEIRLKVLVTEHSKKRLKDFRQSGIEVEDLILSSLKIPGQVPTATRFRGFVAQKGKVFDLVVKDIEEGRLVITVIGKP